MKDSIHLLRRLRKESPLNQKDVAILLDMQASNLIRYEQGHRNPTPEILLTYHMLFDTSLLDILAPSYKHVADTLKTRSKKLIAELEVQESPKSLYKLHYLNEIVNRLNIATPYESRV
ncbi:helix-turn-helix domain-containing protein [Maribacter sp.]|nr:helix-turn-helix domain-containing protein [Maribacter sp.]